jgi:hypothetical protein
MKIGCANDQEVSQSQNGVDNALAAQPQPPQSDTKDKLIGLVIFGLGGTILFMESGTIGLSSSVGCDTLGLMIVLGKFNKKNRGGQ